MGILESPGLSSAVAYIQCCVLPKSSIIATDAKNGTLSSGMDSGDTANPVYWRPV